jgi:hypothetical protein
VIGMSKNVKFSQGDMIRIKTYEYIVTTLDPGKKLDGCSFMEQMRDFCGHEFQVRRVVYNYFDEYQFKMFAAKAPLYILENLICNGVTNTFTRRCDRSCYFLWHERWLEGV